MAVRWPVAAEAAAWFVAATLLGFACHQAALHGTDWRWLVLWLEQPGTVHPQHPGYLVLGRGLWALLAPFGADAYTALRLLSALGGGLAVAATFAAAERLAADRGFARAVALATAGTPVVCHFATVVELHAPFLGLAALANLAAVAWAQRHSAACAVATGALTGLATTVHATGHLLVPALWGAVGLALGFGSWRRALGQGLLGAASHALVWGGWFAAIRALGHLPESVTAFATTAPDDLAAPDHPLAYLARWWRGMHLLEQGPATLRIEFLVALAPVSLLAWAALGRRPLRRFALWFAAVAALYIVVTVALVHARTDERGAYLIPLAAPAVVLALRALPRRTWPLLAAGSLLCGGLLRGEPGRLPPDLAFGRAAAALAEQEPLVFFVADLPEMDGAFRCNPRLELRVARKEYDDLLQDPQLRAAASEPQQVVAWLLGVIRADAVRRGARLCITDQAVDYLTTRLPAFAAAWPQFLQVSRAERLPPAVGIAGVRVP